MATGKKYYWIKLKTDFMTSDKVDYLMSQTNGAEYVVLYQMLCMKCINTDGLLARQIGEVIIPFDAEKIARDCKYFSVDTVKQAFHLFIQLGMIYQESNGYLRIADFENMVGSETDWAAQKRKQVKTKDTSMLECGSSVESSVEKFHTDIRERDKILDIDNINLTPSKKSKPTKQHKELTDFQKINNTYYELWTSLYYRGLVNTEKPIIPNFSVITNLEKSLLKSISVETVVNAIKNCEKNDFVKQNGYSFQIILSGNVMNQLVNGQTNRKTALSKCDQVTDNEVLF